MANMSLFCRGASSRMAVGCRISLDTAGACQQRSMAVLQLGWIGLPSSLRYQNRPAPLTSARYPTTLSSPAKTMRCAMSDSSFLEPISETFPSMQETYDALAQRLLEASRTLGPREKYIVGLAGPPGSGKSTIAREVVARLNNVWREERCLSNETTEISVAVPMDGFHLYRWQLDAMDNAAGAHARRGAPWTFDPVRLVDSMVSLREKGSVSLPSFDHAIGDPVEGDIYVEDGHKVVIVEGNYVLLREGTWNYLGNIFDEGWYVQVDLDEAMRRVERRHVLTGKPPDLARYQVTYNDRLNAELIHHSRWNADLWIQSISCNEST